MSILKGGIGGLAFSLLVLALVQYRLPEKYGFDSFIYFIASAPSFIAGSLEASQAVMPYVYLGYWIIVGAFLGWCMDKGWLGKGVSLAVVLSLFFAHYQAYLTLGDNIQTSLGQFTNLF